MCIDHGLKSMFCWLFKSKYIIENNCACEYFLTNANFVQLDKKFSIKYSFRNSFANFDM